MKSESLPAFVGGALFCILAAFLAAAPAHAHKVMVFGYLEGGQVRLEGYFADGKKAEDSLVEVFDTEGRKLLEGKTDGKGMFSFEMPNVPEVKIVLSASMGHRAECTVRRDASPRRGTADGAPVAAVAGKPGPAPPAANSPAVGEDRIRAIVSEELDRKIAPLAREMALLGQAGPSFRDVVGGIGYIAGIAGLLMYFRSRRKSGA